MRTIRHPALLVALVTALALALAPAASPAPRAAGPAGAPPRAHADPARALTAWLAGARAPRARLGMGLPPLRALLGPAWRRRAAAADAALLRAATRGARTAAEVGVPDPDVLHARDVLRGPGGRQTRRMRMASGLESGCPVPGPEGYHYFEVRGHVRAEYVVTTVERAGRFDLTTTVVVEARFDAHSQTTARARLNGVFGEGGRVTVTRRQTATDRRTGRTRPTGPTQRLASALSPLLVLEGDFDDFVARQEDGAPAPARPLRSGVWNDLAQKFVGIAYLAVEREFARVEARMTTPNTCVQLGFRAPDRLAPGQRAEITGVLRAAQGDVPEADILAESTTVAEYVNEQGQAVELVGPSAESFAPGRPWYLFTAPPRAWPAERPVGISVTASTRLGVAAGDVTFAPAEESLAFRVLDATVAITTSARGASALCGEQAGSLRFTGTFADTGFSPDNRIRIVNGQPTGQVSGRVHARLTDHLLTGCRFDPAAGGRVPCQVTAPDQTPRPDGTWPVGFFVRRATPDGELTLQWGLLDPEVGFLEAGDKYCNVSIGGHLPTEARQRLVPLAALQGTEPFTLTFEGTHHLDGWLGGAASIDQTWRITMTLQRVAPDGG